jgi:hypothetical protein
MSQAPGPRSKACPRGHRLQMFPRQARAAPGDARGGPTLRTTSRKAGTCSSRCARKALLISNAVRSATSPASSLSAASTASSVRSSSPAYGRVASFSGSLRPGGRGSGRRGRWRAPLPLASVRCGSGTVMSHMS